MKDVYAVLLSLLGLIGIIFNRFAVEETFRIMPPWAWWRPPVWLGRIIVILSGDLLCSFWPADDDGVFAMSLIYTECLQDGAS
jgi:hypothetical protein